MPTTPPGIAAIRLAFEEARPADVSSNDLESALTWLRANDPELVDRDGDRLVDLITEELEFRSS